MAKQKSDKLSLPDLIDARLRVTRKYCHDKGWNSNNLTFEQIMEIRSLDEWKNPSKNQ
jgi:hypothetical protein